MQFLKTHKNSKKQVTLILITTLLCLSITATATITHHPTSHPTTSPPRPIQGYVIMLEEDFTDGNIPPQDPLLGQWTHINTSNNETWYIDQSQPYSEPNCTTVHRGNYKGTQNECLITPILDFSEHQEIFLRFHYYTSQYSSQEKDTIDLNVSITIDNGQNWTQIWNEDTIPFFISWTWQDSQEIDLTAYAGAPNAQIMFQYYSTNNTDPYLQEYSIDDIIIYGNSTKFSCTAGGSYEISWSWNKLNGIRFHGDAKDGQPPYLNWTWDFGDGHTSKIPYAPLYSYSDIGVYNITLVVTDSANPKHIAFDNTTVKVIETPPPEIDITVQSPSLGIKAELKNTGTINISFIDWSMNVEWGPLKAFDKEIANGTISNLEGKTSTFIQSQHYFFGFGFIRIIITIEPLNTYRNELQVNAIKLGPFTFGVH
ncbi:MAG: PKD domain-containing protein [Candidatus Thermoplasmatota archaeon]|nr:PKD domain-containing protein [Candidatus Thermoplasmatota archaeon]